MKILVAIFTGLMLLIGSLDVTLRYFFNAPLSWGLPIVGLFLGLTVFCGMTIISRDDEHITVGLLDRWIHGRTRLVQAIAVNILSLISLLFISERMFSYGLESYNDSTQHMMIDLSVWPYAIIFSVLSLISASYVLKNLIDILRSGKARDLNPNSETTE